MAAAAASHINTKLAADRRAGQMRRLVLLEDDIFALRLLFERANVSACTFVDTLFGPVLVPVSWDLTALINYKGSGEGSERATSYYYHRGQPKFHRPKQG